MNKQNIFLSLVTFAAGIIGIASVAAPVYADMCTTQYGGSTTCQSSDLTINKQVENPVTNVFVENLTTTDPTFGPGASIHYRLIIKNNSGETFNPVTVKDIFPPYVTFVSGPGTYDSGNNTLTFTLNNLIAGESRTVELVGKVVDANHFASKSLFCVTNVANVTANNRNDSDSAQACLQNGTVTLNNLPVAGVDDLSLLLPFMGVGLGGFALLKKRG